jgi:O-antigen ligase
MYSGVTVFKNMLGMTCLICGLGSVCCFSAAYWEQKDTDRVRHLVPHATTIAMAIWLFFTADSMTSLSCFVMAGSLIVLTSITRFARKPVILHLLVAAVVGLSLYALFLPGSGLVESLGRDSTLTGRTAIWSAVLSVARHPLFGTGFESFWAGDRLQKVWDAINENGIQEAHNGYLEVYLNLGWIGVSLLAVLIVTGYRNIISLFRRDPEAARIRLAFFVVGVIFSFTEAGFRMMSLVWIAFLLATMAVPQTRLRKARTASRKVSADHLPAEVPILTGHSSLL